MHNEKLSNPQTAISILIPAYNEEASIRQVIQNVQQVMSKTDLKYEVIIIDDGSKDKTAEEAVKAGAKVLRHVRNRGYGASLKTGIVEAEHEIIVITDADGTYPVDRIPEMVEILENADMVVGARAGQTVKIPLVRKPAKWVLRKFAQFITGEKIPDLNSGLRAFRKSFVMPYFNLLSNRFSFTTTLTVASLCDQYHVVYFPIDYYKRSGKSKIVPWDFFNFIILIIRLSMFFNPLKVFIPIFSFCLLLGFGKLGVDIALAVQKTHTLNIPFFSQEIISSTTAILFFSALQILLLGMLSDALARRMTVHNAASYKTQCKGYVELNSSEVTGQASARSAAAKQISSKNTSAGTSSAKQRKKVKA